MLNHGLNSSDMLRSVSPPVWCDWYYRVAISVLRARRVFCCDKFLVNIWTDFYLACFSLLRGCYVAAPLRFAGNHSLLVLASLHLTTSVWSSMNTTSSDTPGNALRNFLLSISECYNDQRALLRNIYKWWKKFFSRILPTGKVFTRLRRVTSYRQWRKMMQSIRVQDNVPWQSLIFSSFLSSPSSDKPSPNDRYYERQYVRSGFTNWFSSFFFRPEEDISNDKHAIVVLAIRLANGERRALRGRRTGEENKEKYKENKKTRKRASLLH